MGIRWLFGAALMMTGAGVSGAYAQTNTTKPTKADYLEATKNLGLNPENHLQWEGRLVAWSTTDSIRFGEMGSVCPVSLCGTCGPVLVPLPGIALTGAKQALPPPFSLAPWKLRVPKAGAYDVEIAIILNDGSFHHHLASLSTAVSKAWSLTSASRTIALNASETPRMVDISDDPRDAYASNILIGGTGRLILRVLWNDQTGLGQLGRESSAAIKPLSEDLLSAGGGLFGGSNGDVAEWQFNVPPVVTATGIIGPIRVLDDSGAMGDAGWVAVKEDGRWEAFQPAPGPFRDFRFIRDARGLGVMRYPATGDPVYANLRDTPTRFASVEFEGRAIPLNAGDLRIPLFPSRMSGTGGAKLVFADPERNFGALALELSGISGDTVHLGKDFVQTARSGACAGPGFCVQPEKPILILQTGLDSVFLTMTVQASRVDGTCFTTLTKTDSAWKVSAPWKSGSRLLIASGGAKIVFYYQTPDAVRPGIVVRGTGTARVSRVRFDAVGRVVDVSEGGADGLSKEARIPVFR
jgi:hypothetical protein